MTHAKKLIALSGIASLIVGAVPFLAVSKGRPTWSMPTSAIKLDDDTYYLGTKQDPQTGRLVDGYAFLKHRDETVRGGQANKPAGKSACYAYLATGAKWKSIEPWVMNPANAPGLNQGTVFALEANGIAKWLDATDGNVTNGTGVTVMGSGTTTASDLSVDAGTLNGVNEVYFADIAGSNSTIAVTSVWGIFSGPTNQRVLVEWDQVFDDVTFDWSASATGVTGKMDFDNIATHELGHAFGLGHPSNICTQETMYAYAADGETLKRSLNTGDINGINNLY